MYFVLVRFLLYILYCRFVVFYKIIKFGFVVWLYYIYLFGKLINEMVDIK